MTKTTVLRSPASAALYDFVTLLHAKQAARSETKIEFEDDPRHPGRTAVRITGPTREAVQAAITRQMTAASGDSYVQFINPGRIDGGKWGSLGEVINYPVPV